jgi:hypothetical protein
MAAAKTPPKYSVLDLTYDQIDAIERASGIPYQQWGDEDQPLGKLNPLLHAAFTGKSLDEMRALTPRQWTEMNKATGDADPEA